MADFIKQEKTCIICHKKFKGFDSFCDDECRQVYFANKEFIDKEIAKGTTFAFL